MSVTMTIRYRDGRQAHQGFSSQSGARLVSEWARSRGLPLLSTIENNGWPQFGRANLKQLIAELEQLRDHMDHAHEGKANFARSVLPMLYPLLNDEEWTDGDFG
jgi:hypothetical protein